MLVTGGGGLEAVQLHIFRAIGTADNIFIQIGNFLVKV